MAQLRKLSPLIGIILKIQTKIKSNIISIHAVSVECLIAEMQYFLGNKLGQKQKFKIAYVKFLVILMSIFASDNIVRLQILRVLSFCTNFKNYVNVTNQL